MSTSKNHAENASPSTRGQRRRPGRERLLNAAAVSFYEDGLSGTGVDRIIANAGIAKGTMYSNFNSKDALIDAYLADRHHQTVDALRAATTTSGTLADHIDAVFDYVEQQVAEHSFRGCAFVIAAAEIPDTDRPPARWAQANKRAVYELMFDMFTRADHDAPQIAAEQLCLLYDGALVGSSLRPGGEAAAVARRTAHTLFLRDD